ncbi:unnamed protein product [Oncorhynchus mykiss]|uniref:Ras-related protein Rab-14 n=1 Tax=Oncorhynchus mykiss TaxID=8022 RepID=A0A060YRJ2_ONCMY|nr:unnamed protein product [Oncorhynchus mykiss]
MSVSVSSGLAGVEWELDLGCGRSVPVPLSVLGCSVGWGGGVIILIGNKADLEAQRDVTYEEAKQFAEENGLLFLEASAKTGENVEDAFLEAAKKIYQNIQDGSLDLNAAESGVQHKPSAPQGGPLSNEPQPQREGCGC